MTPDYEYSRVEAIWALAGESSPETEELLLGWINDSNPQVRKAALSVLGDWFNPVYEPIFMAALYDEDDGVKEVAAKYLVSFGADAARLSAVRYFGKTNPHCHSPQLVSALRDDCCRVRQSAARFLESVGDEECIGDLLTLAHDRGQNSEGRRKAVRVLGNFDRIDVLDALGTLLADDEVGRDAGKALGGKSSRYAHDLLLSALSDRDRESRLSGAIGVGSNGDVRALRPLRRMLRSDIPLERMIAAGTLADVAGKINAKGRRENACDGPAATRMRTVVAPLTMACQDEDINVRQEALRALGAIGMPESASYILAALQDDSDMVFSSGAEAAAAMNLTEVLDIYLKMFQEDLPDDYNSRLSSAINCLGRLGDKRAVAFLQRCADSAYWGTKVEAAQALLALGDASRWDLFEQALSDRDRDWVYYCRAGIARAVAESGDSRTVDLLLKVLETIDIDYECDAQLLEALIECLAEIGDPRSEEPIKKWQHYEFENVDSW